MLSALDDARQQQRRLIDDAAHELRNPLTSLRTNIDVLVEGAQLDPDDLRGLLADLRDQVNEFSSLVADLGVLTIDHDAPAGDVVALRDVIDSAVRRVGRRATNPLQVSYFAPALVAGTASMLEKAFVNVIDNAMKFSPSNEMVNISVEGGTIEVADRGTGISPKELPRVFERFWRSNATSHVRGTGLGLAIVRDIIEQHGGTIILNPNPAGGTIVRMEFPVVGAEGDDAAQT